MDLPVDLANAGWSVSNLNVELSVGSGELNGMRLLSNANSRTVVVFSILSGSADIDAAFAVTSTSCVRANLVEGTQIQSLSQSCFSAFSDKLPCHKSKRATLVT